MPFQAEKGPLQSGRWSRERALSHCGSFFPSSECQDVSYALEVRTRPEATQGRATLRAPRSFHRGPQAELVSTWRAYSLHGSQHPSLELWEGREERGIVPWPRSGSWALEVCRAPVVLLVRGDWGRPHLPT